MKKQIDSDSARPHQALKDEREASSELQVSKGLLFLMRGSFNEHAWSNKWHPLWQRHI